MTLGPSFPCQYNFVADNFGSSYNNALGTSVSTGGSANTKGSDTNLLNGIAEDCYFLEILFCEGSGTQGRMMADIKIDPAAGVGNAGSSWTTLIANLACQDPQLATQFGCWFGFPIYLPAGTAIGTALQWSGGSGTCRLGVRVYGKPSRPELLRVGTKVQTLGANTSTSSGVTVTPGTNAKGSYSATLGTLNLPSWWFQTTYLSADSTQTGGCILLDVAINATNKIIVLYDQPTATNSSEQTGQVGGWWNAGPLWEAPSGEDVFVRAASCVGAPDSSVSAIVYVVQ